MGLRRRPASHTPRIPGLSRLAPLASGGFATVYEAWQESLGRKVAVKVLHERSPDHAMLRRFHEECRLAGTLSHHPNVVPVYSSGFEEGVGAFIVMELMPGGTLRDRLRRGGISREEALRVLAEVAGALESAHRRGVVHGDVKPENILFDSFGRARLGDFGIARVGAGRSTSTVAATIRYAAPEVLDGAPPTAASDVFSLACVGVELLSGCHPFVDDDASSTAVVASILRGELRPQASGTSRPVDGAVRDALALDAAQRPATAGAFGARLADAAKEEGTPMPPLVVLDMEPSTNDDSITEVVVRRSRRRGRLVVAAVAAALVVVVGLVVATRGTDDPSTEVTTADAAAQRPPAVDDEGRLTYAFPTTDAGDLRVARRWLYDAEAGELRNEVTLTSVSGNAVQQALDEVIPKEVATDVSQLVFDPPPSEVVQADPIVRFQIDLAGDASTVLTWVAPVGAIDSTALASLAAARDAAEAAHLASLSGQAGDPGAPGEQIREVAAASTTAPPAAVVTSPPTRRQPGTTAAPEREAEPVATTAAPTTAPPPDQPTATTAPVRAPGHVDSFVARDPIPENFVNGVPQQVRVTFDWSPPSDDGGQSPTGYRLRCTAMQRSQTYDGPAPCRGGFEVSRPAGTSRSTTVLIDRLDGELTWIKWEIAAVNDGGTGGYRTAQVRVPNVVGMYSWEAFPVGRAVGLMVGGDTPEPCGQSKDTICRQSIAAGTVAPSGAHFALAASNS